MSDEFADAHRAIEEGKASELRPDYHKLDAYEQEIWSLVDKARECVNATVIDAAVTLADLQAASEGCWASVVMHGEDVLANLHGRAIDYAIAHMSDAYNQSLQYGVIVPRIEDILAAHGDPAGIPPPPPPNGGNPPPPPPPPAGPGCPPNYTFCMAPDFSAAACVPPLLLMPDGTIVSPQQMWDGVIGDFVPITGWATACITPNFPDITPPTFTVPDGSSLTSNPYPSSVPSSAPSGGIWSIGVSNGTMTATNPQFGGIGATPSPPPPPPPPPPPGGGPTSPPVGTISTTPAGSVTQMCQPQQCYPTGYPPVLTGQMPLPITDETPPPPDPPDPPSVDQSLPTADSPQFQISASVVSTGWCDVVQKATPVFASVGQALMSDWAFPVTSLAQIAGIVVAAPISLVSQVIQAAVNIFQNTQGGAVIAPIQNALNQMSFCDFTLQTQLLVCRKFFEFVNGIRLGGKQTVGMIATAGIGAGAFGSIVGVKAEMDAKADSILDLTADFAFLVNPLTALLDQCIRYACPQEVPAIPEAMRMYLKGQITLDQMNCLIQVRGGRTEEYAPLLQAEREQLRPDEIVRLWLRQELDDTEVHDRLRNTGMIQDSEIDNKLSLADEVPHIQDIVRFMTRNIYNPDVLERFDLDAEFDRAGTEPGGQLDDWRKAQGITDEGFRAYWRAHWTVPAVTHMQEMIQRLRPGRVDPSLEVTADDFDQVLRENDWLEHWRPRMLALSYRPLTRIDARRAYNAGVIQDQDYISALQDIGYAADTANTLLAFAKKDRLKQLRANKLFAVYEKNGITESDLTSSLLSKGYTQDDIDSVLADVNDDIAFQQKIYCIDQYGKSFQNGALDEQEFRQALLSAGVDAFQADSIINRLSCGMKIKEKHEDAGKLCDWYSKGMITPDDFATRLTNIGYEYQDVLLIVQRCNIKITEASVKAQEQAAQKAAKSALTQQRLRDTNRKNRMKTQRMITKLANKLAQLNGTTPDVTTATIVNEIGQIEATHGLNPEQSYYMLEGLSQALPRKGPVKIAQLIDESALSFVRSLGIGLLPVPPGYK
jgi:hypothetical protein